jgi:hypothetical protein
MSPTAAADATPPASPRRPLFRGSIWFRVSALTAAGLVAIFLSTMLLAAIGITDNSSSGGTHGSDRTSETAPDGSGREHDSSADHQSGDRDSSRNHSSGGDGGSRDHGSGE